MNVFMLFGFLDSFQEETITKGSSLKLICMRV